MTCPRCHGLLVRAADDGVFCLSCGFTTETDNLDLYAEVMATLPGGPTRAERHDIALKKTRKTRWEERGRA